jgi:transcriptional regulator of acetoin/glycerol metabolism
MRTNNLNTREARACLMAGRLNDIRPSWIASQIRESWQRCLSARLNPESLPVVDPVSADQLKELRAQNARLCDIARIEIKNLYSQIAGSHFVIAFATKEAVILDSVADPSFSAIAQSCGILPGSHWEEEVRGTNALGCAAATLMPAVVHASEHFFLDNCHLTCVANPIFDHADRLIGLIDASSDCRSRQINTVALIRMSALHIEAELFRDTFKANTILQFHNRQEFVHTLEAGLLAIGNDSRIIAANRQARCFLSDLPAGPGQSFDSVFSISFERFIGRMRTHPFGQLTDRKGSTYFVVASGLLRRPNLFTGLRCRDERRAIELGPSGHQPDFVAEDPAVQQAIRTVEKAVQWGVPILIRGETGTGKELLAQYAHTASGRRGRFVPVNCNAIPESLIESEFFGYREGAFTGGRRGGARGLVVDADQGTLFLDEIGDMPVALQATLLRFLDQSTVRAVGASVEERVDIQVIAATNSDLDEAVGAGRFRPDLLYRLRVVEVNLPPLRNRQDFDLAVANLLRTFSLSVKISDQGLQILRSHNWPGNFRELKNTLLRILIGADSDELSATDVLSALASVRTRNDCGAPSPLRTKRNRMIREAYERCQGNITRTARELCVSRNTVYRELRRGGLLKQESVGDRGSRRR